MVFVKNPENQTPFPPPNVPFRVFKPENYKFTPNFLQGILKFSPYNLCLWNNNSPLYEYGQKLQGTTKWRSAKIAHIKTPQFSIKLRFYAKRSACKFLFSCLLYVYSTKYNCISFMPFELSFSDAHFDLTSS